MLKRKTFGVDYLHWAKSSQRSPKLLFFSLLTTSSMPESLLIVGLEEQAADCT